MEKNNAITGLRGVVIFLIVFRHFSARYSEIFQDDKSIIFPFSTPNGGTIGNIIFMMLMGYFMAKSLQVEKYGLRESIKYIVNRYWRFWPSYALAVILISLTLYVFPLPGRTPNLTTSIVDFFFIIHPGFDNVDGSHWFLTVMLVIQIVLTSVLLVKSLKIRNLIIICIAIFLFLLIIADLFQNGLLVWGKDMFFYSLITIIGILIYWYKNKRIIIPIIILTTALVYLYTSALSIPIVTTVLIILFTYIVKYPTSFRILAKFPFIFIGEISFQWYLVHQNIGYVIMYYLLPKGSISILWIFVPIMATLAIAYCMNLVLKKLPTKLLNN